MTSSIRHLGRHLFPLQTKEIKTCLGSTEGANRRLDLLSLPLNFEPSDHPFVHAITIHHSIHSFSDSSIYLCIFPFVHLFAFSSIYSSNHPSIHSGLYQFIPLTIHSSFINLSLYQSFHPFLHSSIHPCFTSSRVIQVGIELDMKTKCEPSFLPPIGWIKLRVKRLS